MLNKVMNAQVSDTTGDAISYAVKLIINYFFLYLAVLASLITPFQLSPYAKS
jgi:hypothetical protein